MAQPPAPLPVRRVATALATTALATLAATSPMGVAAASTGGQVAVPVHTEAASHGNGMTGAPAA
jgi:hypothetical protein